MQDAVGADNGYRQGHAFEQGQNLRAGRDPMTPAASVCLKCIDSKDWSKNAVTMDAAKKIASEHIANGKPLDNCPIMKVWNIWSRHRVAVPNHCKYKLEMLMENE
jgi:hypothetical protein